MLKQSLRTLVAESVDYAGLFPPAALPMDQAVANYALYCRDPQAWMLARLVVPVARLAELEAAARQLLPHGRNAAPWRLSVLAGPDLAADIAQIVAFNARHEVGAAPGAARIDTIELKAEHPGAIDAIGAQLPAWLAGYVEIPIAGDPGPLIARLAQRRLRAKVRTGGVLPELFPAADDLVRFMAACLAAELPFKATAGLHHPLRASYRLTYAPNGPAGMMYGYLNLLLAAALLLAGAPQADAAALLQETDPSAFVFDDAGVAWRGRRLGTALLAQTREQVAPAFGSCSFREPVDELRGLGLL